MMKLIETRLNVEGYLSEIKIDDEVIKKLALFLGVDEKDAYNELSEVVINKLDELDSSEKIQSNSVINDTLTLAYEKKDNFFSYKQITFNIKLVINKFKHIEGVVTLWR